MAERIALLDINVLIALIDPQHVHHDPSHSLFQVHGGHGWAMCPFTQNDLLRILGHPRYPNSPGGPAVVMPLLQGLLAIRPMSFGLVLCPGMPLESSRRMYFYITDTYLLALAVHHQATLVSFDPRLSSKAVCGGSQTL